MDIGGWLKGLDLERYEDAFRQGEIDLRDLPELTEADLQDLGIPVGPRRRLLKAIRYLGGPTTSLFPPPAPEARDAAERRQLTVMFCDLVGSTALSARMDPEDLREVIGAYQVSVSNMIQTYDGHVAKFMGDGILAYFGYPRAHEDDAERAVRASLEMIQVVNALKTRAPHSLQVRIGIATGLVVVGDLIGEGTAQEQAVVGETPNVAARLQSLASPDSIIIGPTTRRLLGDLFEYQDLGPIEVRGFHTPVQAYQVLRTSSVESRFEALRTTAMPLVGREEELELLMRRWQRAKRGDGQVVLLSGEPGIGKSRMAQVIQDRIGAEPHTRLRYFSSPYHQDSALYPVLSRLERVAGFRREDTNQQRLTKLKGVLAQATHDLMEAVPLFADLLSISIGDRYPPLNLTPQKRKEKTLNAILAQVEGLAARQPVLMIFEDLQWADPTTREWIDLLVDRASELRVLLIMTFRSEFSAPWVGRCHVTLLTLNRLSPRQRAEMISGVVGGKAMPKEIAAQIIERTDGIPLFVEELTKAVIESGVVTEAGDHYQITGSLMPLAIPTSLHASLLARLDRLRPIREVAQIAAALGRQFSYELISAVSALPQQQLDHALDQLLTAELIFRRGTPPDAEYTFKHALVQDASYSTLLKSRRQQIHSQIVKTLEKKFTNVVAAQPALMARHCVEAGLIQNAVAYWVRAGQQSVAHAAMAEAVTQIRKGLDLLSEVPEGDVSQEQELNLQISLAHALMATKGFAATEAGKAFGRAYELCERLNRASELGPIIYGQWAFCQVRGHLQEAERYSEKMHHLGLAQSQPAWTYFGLYTRGVTCSFLGKFTIARGFIQQALCLWQPTYRALAPSPLDPFVAAQTHLFRTLLCLGYLDQAQLRRDQALPEARRLSPYTLAYTLFQAWYIHCACDGINSAEMTLRLAEEVLAISTEQGFTFPFAVGNIMRGWCLSALGQSQEGISLLRQGINSYRTTGAVLGVPLFLSLLAEAYCIEAQPQEGLNHLAEATQLMNRTQQRWAEAEIHRVRARLLLSENEHTLATESLHRALAAARQQSAKFWELRAAHDLACLWRDQGRRAEAGDLLAPVYNWFTEGHDTPVLKEAKALLEQLSA